MSGVEHLGWFVLAGWLLNLTPGPDVLCITTQAARGGFRAGAWATLGVTAACFVHVAAAALGLGALMATSATAFTLLKWVGAAYLFWSGWQLLRASPKGAPEKEAAHALYKSATGQKDAFFAGLWTNLLNPKVALFFLAFVPQFIAPEAPHKTLSFLLLGALFNLNSLPVNLGFAALAAHAARKLAAFQQRLHWLDRVAGAMFIGFGVKLALTESPQG